MLFDVPALADEGYADFLARNRGRLASVHFALPSASLADARVPGFTAPLAGTVRALHLLPGVKKYVLINGAFHHPDVYTDRSFLRGLIADLEMLIEQIDLTGVVYVDHYLLTVLSRTAPDLAAVLEAVPSINTELDAPEAIFSAFEYISATRFRLPAAIVPDRTMNRDLAGLTRLAAAVRRHFPCLRIRLLANEGCLYRCPFRRAHAGHIALSRFLPEASTTFRTNNTLGCSDYYFHSPESLLKSPFIRPEDVSLYNDVGDGIKLCGRTREPTIVRRILESYFSGKYEGNLLEIMDSMEPLADVMKLDNGRLPADFARTTATCSKLCFECGYCRRAAEKAVTVNKPRLADLRRN